MESIPPGLFVLLKKCFHEEIINCKISAGSNPGDNVIGKMLSVKVATTIGSTYDLVVKASIPFRNNEGEAQLTPEERLFARLVWAFGSYQAELDFYQRILPGIEALNSELHGHSLPVPKIFFGQKDEENEGLQACLILEDTRPKGYRMADKMKGLTWDEVIMVLEKIAKFHAVSRMYLCKSHINIHNQTDPLATHVCEKTLSIGVEKVHQEFLKQLCADMCELGKAEKVISAEMYEKVLKITEDAYNVILSASKQASKEHFPVVIHGDLWVNNFMFKYDEEGNPIDVKFIDFQQTRYASVFDDLHYFIYTSTTAAFRKKNLDVCLDFYLRKFNETIQNVKQIDGFQDLDIGELTPTAFQNGYKKFLASAFCYGVIAIPFQLGIPPANGKADENLQNQQQEEDANVQVESKEPDLKELRKFAETMFQGMAESLKASARNSPEALKRFGEFCIEMDELGVFQESNIF